MGEKNIKALKSGAFFFFFGETKKGKKRENMENKSIQTNH